MTYWVVVQFFVINHIVKMVKITIKAKKGSNQKPYRSLVNFHYFSTVIIMNLFIALKRIFG